MRTYLFAIALAASCLCQGGEIYRWVDDNGKVHFSDKPAWDDSVKTTTIEKDDLTDNSAEGDFCNSQYTLAKAVMRDRQMGRPMPVIVALYGKGDGNSLYRQIIQLAYSKPRYSTREYQIREISDFASDIYAMCLSGGP